MRVRAAIFLLLLVLWTVALLSPVPQASAVKTLGGPSWVFLIGKGLHVSVYAILAMIGFRLGPRWWITPATLLVHAGLTELLQPMFDRGGSLRDVGLDAAGIALGTGLLSAIRRPRE